jgi:hypothetical protein
MDARRMKKRVGMAVTTQTGRQQEKCSKNPADIIRLTT